MYWRQKGELVFSTNGKRNQRLAQIQSYLADKSLLSSNVVASDTSDGPIVRIVVDYASKVDADQVWSDVQAMRDTADITGGFMGYGSVAESDVEVSEFYGYRWWY